jgi:ribosome-binding factor A
MRSRHTFAESKASSIRSLRLEELIREEMNFLFDSEVDDERLEGIRVTTVELSPDGARARIWYTIMNGYVDTDDTEEWLRRASGFLRRMLCESLSLKRTPELRFARDPTALLEPDEEQDED